MGLNIVENTGGNALEKWDGIKWVDRRQVKRLNGHGLEPRVRKNRQGLMTLLGKDRDQEQCHLVLESHYACALMAWIFLIGQDSPWTYLLFPEDLVSLDTPWGLLVQGPPFLLDVPLTQASLDHLRKTGRFFRHPDGTWVTLTGKVTYVPIIWGTWTSNTVLLLFLPRSPDSREKNTLKLRRKKYTFVQLKLPIMISTLTLFWTGRKRSHYDVLYVW